MRVGGTDPAAGGAGCTSPAGAEATTVYNGDFHLLQYCNGTHWMEIGPCIPGYGWTARDSNRNWYGVASSSDGTKLVAVVAGGQIYTSTDSGVTWTARDSNRNWFAVASSSDGTKLVAVENGGQIYTSTDSGATWTARDSNRVWRGVAASSDGTKLVAVENGGKIYTATCP